MLLSLLEMIICGFPALITCVVIIVLLVKVTVKSKYEVIAHIGMFGLPWQVSVLS